MKKKRRITRSLLSALALLLGLGLVSASVSRLPGAFAASGPTITNITTNVSEFPGGQVPRYEKFEITFSVDTVAQNPQLPFDPSPPPGLEPGIGITVNALFTPDNWQTVYTQPAFYYQEFEHEIRSGKDWIYPTGKFVWKVRFAPTRVGTWQFKLTARDASGFAETEPQSFTVVSSNNKGFVRVSKRDPRYFEFENGDYFLGLGYNLTFNQLDWDNPTVINEPRFQKFQENGLQFFRFWMSQWGIFTSAWNAWDSPLPERHAQYIPYASLSNDQAYPGSDVSMALTWKWNPGMFLGFMKQAPAVKRNSTYRLTIRYLIPKPLQGPRIAGYPYGLVAKTGGWLTGPGSWPDNIYGFVDPGTGTVVSDYASNSPTDDQGKPQWATLEGEISVGNRDFLPRLYLVLENVADGSDQNGGGNVAYIDRVELREVLGNGQYGPNIISQSWMAHHLYFDQRQSYAFDLVLDLAKEYDIYLRPVIMEKNEWILNRIDFDGNPIRNDSRCWDADPANDPAECPGNRWFYGNGRQVTKVRWLQQAWWRYLQARWGYSTQIHSWELLNEGDPWNGQHYLLADEFGRYMHQFVPNDHLVTTSFWHSFPKDAFWANTAYPNIDYADLHAYATNVTDTAANTVYYSEKYGAKQPDGAGKPLIRGETGFSSDVVNDTEGVWLHNYIWATVNSGGMYDQYWYAKDHIEQARRGNDLRYHFRAFANFMRDIPLNNGQYEDAQPISSNERLRVWGQKDLLHGQAHLWIQNRDHTWKNVVDGVEISPASGTVTLAGFQPGARYEVAWWDPYQPDESQQVLSTETLKAQSDGSLVLAVQALVRDIAVKITPLNDGATGPDAGLQATGAVTQTISLSAGWNLISFSVVPSDTRVSSVLAPIIDRVSAVLSYDGGALSYYPNVPQSTLKRLDAQHGYWIKLTAPATLVITGTRPTTATIPLKPGWNLLSYLPDRPMPLTTALASIAGEYSAVLGFNGGAASWYAELPPSVNSLTTLQPRQGYWVYMTQAANLVYP